jgi:hypothetical protein
MRQVGSLCLSLLWLDTTSLYHTLSVESSHGCRSNREDLDNLESAMFSEICFSSRGPGVRGSRIVKTTPMRKLNLQNHWGIQCWKAGSRINVHSIFSFPPSGQ